MENEPLKVNGLYPSGAKIAVKYNYWDYVDSFNKALLYENANKKHSQFIKICFFITFERELTRIVKHTNKKEKQLLL